MQRILQTFAAFLLLGAAAFATVFGTVRGIVHDPQHRPVSGSEVVLKAKSSDYTQKTQTDANGEFHFDAVPLGEYTVTVTDASFAGQEQRVTVLSGDGTHSAFRTAHRHAEPICYGFGRSRSRANRIGNADNSC